MAHVSMLALLLMAQLDLSASSVTLEAAPRGAALRQGPKQWLLAENDWPEAFDLVPSVRLEAQAVRDRMHLIRFGKQLARVGVGVAATGLVVAASALGLALAGVGTLPLVFGLVFTGAALGGLGLIFVAIGGPMMLLEAGGEVPGLVRRHNEALEASVPLLRF